MNSPTQLISELERIVRNIQTNNAFERQQLYLRGMQISEQLRKLGEQRSTCSANIEGYCLEFDLHLERLRDASRSADGNHIDLLGAQTSIDKLKGFAGFNLP